MNTINLEQLTEMTSATISKWTKNGLVRHYVNIPGMVDKIWLENGKVHYQMGKGRNADGVSEQIEKIIGCAIIDRRREAAKYVVVVN